MHCHSAEDRPQTVTGTASAGGRGVSFSENRTSLFAFPIINCWTSATNSLVLPTCGALERNPTNRWDSQHGCRAAGRRILVNPSGLNNQSRLPGKEFFPFDKRAGAKYSELVKFGAYLAMSISRMEHIVKLTRDIQSLSTF